MIGSPSDDVIGTSGISVDDVTMVNCDPNYVPANKYNISCDFETSSCGWYQETTIDEFDWQWLTAPPLQGLGLGKIR